jgi:hypothetical protein
MRFTSVKKIANPDDDFPVYFTLPSRINQIGHIIMPFLLIGLGAYVLAQPFLIVYLLTV